jgi:hypothetical protein
MLGNIIPWTYNEYRQSYKDISRISPLTWKQSAHGIEWDDNPFFNNNLFHPYQGNHYYNATRSAGFGFWTASIATLLGSLAWECCSERRPASFNDPFTTALGGIALGEGIYRLTTMIPNRQDSLGTLPFSWRYDFLAKGGMIALNPARALARWTLDNHDIKPDSTELPDDWGFTTGAGSLLGGSIEPFVFAEVDYGTLFREVKKPYDIFWLRVQFGGRSEQRVLVESQGVISQITRNSGRMNRTETRSALVVAHGFDYIQIEDKDAKREGFDSLPLPPDAPKPFLVGSQTLGLSGMAAAKPGWGQVKGTLGAHAVFAGISTPHTAITGQFIAERIREYDYVYGAGARTSLWVQVKRVQGELHARYFSAETINGSTELRDSDSGETIARFRAEHNAWAWGLRGQLDLPADYPIALAFDALWLHKHSDWTQKEVPNLPTKKFTREDDDQGRRLLQIFLTWTYSKKRDHGPLLF